MIRGDRRGAKRGVRVGGESSCGDAVGDSDAAGSCSSPTSMNRIVDSLLNISAPWRSVPFEYESSLLSLHLEIHC